MDMLAGEQDFGLSEFFTADLLEDLLITFGVFIEQEDEVVLH